MGGKESDTELPDHDRDAEGSPDADAEGESDPGGARLGQRTTTTSSHLKRKHSPSPSTSHSHSRSPAPPSVPHPQGHSLDAPVVAPLPLFTPHTAHLPPSPFDFFSTSRNHPTNKQNYRYTPCGPSLSPANAHLPLQIHRTIESLPQAVRFSWEDRSSFVLITQDARTITAEKGWRAARANVPVRDGNWYWEIKVARGGGEGGRDTVGGIGEGSWCRIGVGRRESPLNAPVGFDGHSYAYRDRLGDAVTLSRPKPYGKAYGTHSTIGVYLSLPTRPVPDPADRRDPARIIRKRVPIRYKGQLYFESLEYTSSKEMDDLNIDPATKAKVVVEEKKAAAPGTKARPPVDDLTPPPRPLPKLPQSRLAFFLDGECQGVAFEDLYDFLPLRLHPGGFGQKGIKDPRENWHDDGMMGYFPFVSVFGGAIATINPGPNFDFPPPEDIEAVLAASPHPPSSPPLQPPPPSTGSENPKAWKPLSDRYVQFLAEQNRLDDLDEAESIRVYHAAKLAEALAAKNAPPRPSSSTTLSATTVQGSKKSKLAAPSSKVLAGLGAINTEDVVSLGSPMSNSSRTASPAPPSAPYSFSNLVAGMAGTPSALREVVPESDGEEIEERPVRTQEEDVKMKDAAS